MNERSPSSNTIAYAVALGVLAAIVWGVVESMAVAIWGHRIPLAFPSAVVGIYVVVGILFGGLVGVMARCRTSGHDQHGIVRQAILNAAVVLSLVIFIERARRGFAYVTDPSPIVPLTVSIVAALATILRARAKSTNNANFAGWFVTIAFAALFCTLWMPFSQLYQAPLISWTSFLGGTSFLALVAISYLITRRVATSIFRNLRFDRPAIMLKVSATTAVAGLAVATCILSINMKQPLVSDAKHLASADQDKPNVVLIVMDCARADMLSVYGYSLPTTPILENFATESVKYDHAIVTAPWTLPSHASMFTGLLPSQHKAHMIPNGVTNSIRPLDNRFDTLAESLTREGYKTGAVVANAACLNRDLGMGQGFQYYDDRVTASFAAAKPETISPVLWLTHWYKSRVEPSKTGWSRNAAEINRDVYTWLNTVDDNPFFLFINYLDAHEPYFGHRQFAESFNQSAEGGSSTDLQRYQQEVAYVDQQIGQLFDRLKDNGKFDNSLIIVTSDHGEGFGEHGHHGHCGTLHEEELHVPLLVRYPGGKIVDTKPVPVSLASLPELVSDVVGKPLVKQSADFEKPPYVVAELRVCESGACGIARATYLDDGRKVIFDGRGGVEMYNLLADPREQYDLSFLADHRVLVSQSQLLRWSSGIAQEGDVAIDSQFDQELQRRLQSLGYVD